MKKINKSDWQKPYVDVFKKFKVFESSRTARKGQVAAIQDNNIGRKVFKITGAVSASNYMNIPDPDTNIKTLGLHGNYIYIEFLPVKGKFFNFHLDFQIADHDPIVRFTISNMYEAYNKTSGNVLQIPFPKNAPQKWTIMVLDIPFHLENFGLFENTGFTNFVGIHNLKSLQLCSSSLVRGVYTSDNIYKIATLPKEMNFKIPPKDQSWSSVYQMVYYPEEADPDFMNDMQKQAPLPEKEISQQLKDTIDPVVQQSVQHMKKSLRPSQEEPYQSQFNQDNLQQQEIPDQQQQYQDEEEYDEQQQQQLQQYAQNDFKTKSQDEFVKRSFYNNNQSAQKPEQIQLEGLQPYPIAQLSHTIGFSGKYCPDIKWSRTQDSPNELLYAAGSVLVSQEVGTTSQRFFLGHSAPICCMDLSRDGKYIATGQEGKKSLVKIWDYCENQNICTFQAPYENLQCITFSYNNKLLATVGTDNHNRQIIIIWNIDDIENKKKPEIIARQVSDFNIITLKFSPIEIDRLVSCGKENIRFWRIKNGHLPAQTVVLNHHARNTVFTVLDYEFNYSEASAARQSQQVRRVFVGSKSGMLYQIDYQSRLLEGVFKCHDGPVCSISLSAGFCVTGSEDQFLKVWPLDFSEYLIVAKHEGIIHSIDVSQDALMVACGTSTGGLGILDLSNHNYKSILRSHIDDIVQMVYHPHSNYLITLSADLSIRLWDLNTYEQVYEFSYPAEDYCTGIAATPNAMTFTAGFASGTFRVFDIEKTCIQEECRYHDSDITCIQYSADGKYLLVADSTSYYAVYDVERNYQPIKSFECELPSEFQSIALTQDSSLIATIGDSGTHVNIFDAQTLSLQLKMFCPNVTIKKLFFAANNLELFVVTADSKIKVFGIQIQGDQAEAYFLREVGCTHRDSCTDIAHSDNFKYLATVGGDSFLKIWDYDFELKGPGSNQIFMAHLGKINNVIFIPGTNRILTAGGFEGIYEWEFLGDLTPQERDVDFKGLTPHAAQRQNQKKQKGNTSIAHSKQSQDLRVDFSDHEDNDQILQQQNFIAISQQQGQFINDQQFGGENNYIPQQGQIFERQQLTSQLPPQQEEFPVTDSELEENLDKFDENPTQQDQSKKAQDILSNMSMQLSKQMGKTKFIPVHLAQDFDPQVIDFKKQSRKRDRHRRKQGYVPNETRKEFNLPYRHYYFDKLSETLQQKISKIRDNPDEFNLNYVIGYNNDCHENVVWNYMKGWIAYSVENTIVVERLDKERNQKVIQLPDYISCMIMSRDFKHILVGCASRDDKEIAAIHIVETNKWQMVKKLSFHTRGVQSLQFNENGKYLVSIGNFKECTVCVWDWQGGKLLASSYTMDKINDLKVANKCFSYDRQIEFVTVGRDQVQFWAFTKENKLEYYDVFIQKAEGDDTYPEATAVDYIQILEKFYCLVGLQSGELLIYEYGTFNLISRNSIAQGEIVNIYGNSLINRVVLSSLDGNLYYWDTDKMSEDFYPSFVKLGFPSCPISISLEPTFNEGICGCQNGGIFYFNFGNQYQSMITSTIDTQKSFETQVIDSELLYTAHSDGKLKIWNQRTGEEVVGYNFKSPVTASIYLQKNNNEVKILSLDKFSSSETFVENNYFDSDRKAHVYPVKAFEAILGGKQGKFYLNNNGDFYTIEEVIVNKRSVYRAKKILELNGVQQISHYNEKSILVVSTKSGRIITYLVDYNSEKEIPYGFTSIDDFEIYENPHGTNIDVSKEELALTAQIYKEADAETRFALSKQNQGIYYATNSTLQYLFIVERFVLHEFPVLPSLYETKDEFIVFVALQNGSLEEININNKEDRQILQGMLDGPITDIISKRSRNSIILSTKNGLCFYKY